LEPVRSTSRRPVSPFTGLLAIGPLLVVFALLGRFGIAALLAAAALGVAVVARGWRGRGSAPVLLGFSLLGCVLLLFIVLPLLNLLVTTDFSRMLVLARDPSVSAALSVTLSAALVATLIALLFGVPLGYVLAREEFAGKAIVEGIVDVPVVIPHTIAGIALLFIFGRAGVVGSAMHSTLGVQLSDSYWGIVMAMLFVSAPFAANHSRDGFLAVDPRMEYVARSLGASHLSAFFRVTLPLSWRALLSGAILTWARGISEFVAVSVIAYYPKTINSLIYEWYNFFGYERAKPLATLLLVVALTVFVALRAITKVRRPGT
jgi:molybdate/tungstate transport system permease protein